MVTAEGRNYNPDTAATAGESFFHSGNIRTSGAHLQPEWFDYAPQPGKAGEKTTQPACVSEM